MFSHASNALPISMDDNQIFVFFSTRNVDSKSSVGVFELLLDKETSTIKTQMFSKNELIKYGPKDSFYEAGISVGDYYKCDGRTYLLFMGWQNPPNGHWRGDIGRLIWDFESGDLHPSPQSVFFGCDSKIDSISLSYPFVLNEDNIFKMWYGSTVSWDSPNGEMIHVINYATSTNGVDWERHGLAIPYEIGVAQAFSRPTVIKDEMGYHMWFSYRSGDGTPYRIGYAFSADGLNWELRLKDAGIDVSSEGWDSEMVCYPYVFEHSGDRYMLYNGNGYGKTGIGLAIWVN